MSGPGGFLQFWGVPPIFRGGSSNFSGGSSNFLEGGSSNFSGGSAIQVPPPGTADSGIRSTIGQYASYWNAFLFVS